MKHLTLCAVLTLLTSACGTGSSSDIKSPLADSIPTQQSEISSCGGFPASRTSFGERAYCDAEVLRWSFDAATGTIELVDSRVQLNCCGERQFELSQEGGVLVATETDEPVAERGRCRCLCVFDLGLTAEVTLTGVVPFRLDRAIFEQGETQVLYQGELDLSAGAGEIVIDDQPIGAGRCGQNDR